MAIISISGKAGSGKDTVGKIIQGLVLGEEKFVNGIKGFLDSYKDYNPLLYNNHYQIKKWATALRKVSAILLGMDEQFLYTDEFKQMVLPECWNYQKFSHLPKPDNPWMKIGWETNQMTGRDFLQKLGTDAIRNGLHENTWVNALMSEYKTTAEKLNFSNLSERDIKEGFNNYPDWIITDTRFPNELTAVKERRAITIRVERSVHALSQQNHAGLLHPSETALDNAEFDYVIDNNGTIEELVEKIKPIILKINGNGSNSTGE